MEKDQLKIGVMLSYICTAITILVQLVYMPIMIRILGQGEYGLYSLVSGIVSYLSLFSLGFTGAYLRFFSRYRVKKDYQGLASLNGMFITIFCILALLALVCGIFLSFYPQQIFGSKLSSQELQKARILMIIMVIDVAVSLINGIWGSIISAYEKFVFQQVINLLAVICNPFICLPLLLMGKGSVGMVVVATIISFVRLVLNVWYCFCKIQIPIAFHGFQWGLLKEIAIFSSFLLLNMLIDQINWNMDKLILSHTKGTKEIAIYGVASQINSLFMTFSTTISSVFSPRVNQIAAQYGKNYKQSFTRLMAKIGRIQWMILGLVASGFLVFGKYFIVNIYAGKAYERAYTAALFLTLPAIIPLIQNVGIEMQRALNKHQFRSIIYFGMALINIIISIPLSTRFGAIGAAMGTGISLIVANGIIMNLYYHKALKIDMIYFWKEIFHTGKGFLLPIILAIIMIKYVKINGFIGFIFYVILYTSVYFISIFFFSCNDEEKKMLPIIGLRNRNKKRKIKQ